MSDDNQLPHESDGVAGKRGSQADEKVDWDDPSTWPREIGGVKGPEPTRYGDWERNGRCSDF